jgi:predicted dehydrogenase
MIDQALLIIPHEVVSVYCRMHHDYEGVDVESHTMLTLGFSNGATAVVDTSGLCALPKPRWRVCGTKGAFVKYGVDPQERAMIDGNIDAAVEPEANFGRWSDGKSERVVPTLAGRWRCFYEHVADVLTGRAEQTVKLEENRRVMSVFDAAWKSARESKSVETSI